MSLPDEVTAVIHAAPLPAIPLDAQRTPPSVRFSGESGAFWRLLVRGAVLLAVTLGIYRFWLNTDIRRFLWANTEVAGESLEYTGTAIELLLGFLIALAVMVPIYVAYFVAALTLGENGNAIAATLMFLFLALFGQYAVYRARRYRLTRTVYRGVRFQQSGSAWRYAACALFWWVLIIMTLGLALPFSESRLERLKMRHTHYGDLTGAFTGSGLRLFLRGLPMWLLVVAPVVAGLTAAGAALDWTGLMQAVRRSTPETIGVELLKVEGFQTAAVLASVGPLVSILMAVLLFPVFQAMMLRWWASGIRFGELTLTSHLRTSKIYGAYLRFLGLALLFLLVLSAVFGIAAAGYGVLYQQKGETLALQITGAVGLLAFYVILMLGFSVLYRATVRLTLWRQAVESVEIKGIAQLDKVKAEGGPSSAVGEGLADALNVGGF